MQWTISNDRNVTYSETLKTSALKVQIPETQNPENYVEQYFWAALHYRVWVYISCPNHKPLFNGRNANNEVET